MKYQTIKNILVKRRWQEKTNPLAPSNTLHFYKKSVIKPESYFNNKEIQLYIQFYDQDIKDDFNLWSISFKTVIRTGESCQFNFHSLAINTFEDRLEPISMMLINSWRSIQLN